MGKQSRKSRRQQEEYDQVATEAKKTASAYDISNSKAPQHVETNLLAPPSPRRFTLESMTPGKSHTTGVFMNFAASCVGATALFMPFIFRQAGFLPSILLILLVAIATYHSSNVVLNLGLQNDLFTFHAIARRAFGGVGFLSVCFFQLVLSVGITAAYVLVVLRDVPNLLGKLSFFSF